MAQVFEGKYADKKGVSRGWGTTTQSKKPSLGSMDICGTTPCKKPFLVHLSG